MSRTKRTTCVLLACALAFIAMTASAAEPVSETQWGVYAKLAGKQGTFTDDGKQFREEYTWIHPGRVLQLQRVEVASGKEWYRAEIVLSESAGKLLAEYHGRVLRGERDVLLRDDGSALWLRSGLTDTAVLVEATTDGGWTEKMVNADAAGNITKVRSELKRTPAGDAAQASVDTTTPMPPIEAWGVLGRLVGTRWNLAGSDRSVEYSWRQEGRELVEYWRVPGNPRYKPSVYALDPATGEISYTQVLPAWTPRWVGTVQPDGSITFVLGDNRKGRDPYRMWLADNGELHRQDGEMVDGRFVAETTKYDWHEVLLAQAGSAAPAPPPPSAVAATGAGATPASANTVPAPASGTDSVSASGATVASVGDGRPVSQNRKWAAFGPLSYFIDTALYDEASEDLIAITEVNGDIVIASPDGVPKNFIRRRATTTTLTGRPALLADEYAFKQKGDLLADGSMRFRWNSTILGGTMEDTFSLKPGGCLGWVEHSRWRGTDTDITTSRTFCRIKGEARILAAAQKHVDRNIRNGTDLASQYRAARAKAAEEEARQAATNDSDGGGWVGALIGAATGVVAAKAYGGGAEEMASAALMGASIANPGNAAFSHGANVFQDEMAKKHAEQAEADARIARIAAQAEAAENERRRQQREREARERQQQLAREQAGQSAAQGREREAREQQAEQQRLAAEKAAAERKRQAELARQQEAEQRRLAEEQAKARKQQELRQTEANLRNSFRGRAITCAGGGKDVLYLQGSQPAKTGCNVSFEARCPATPAGAGVQFSQHNWIGASCGFGDNVRIGHMNCPAEQVQVSMTRADCGSGG